MIQKLKIRNFQAHRNLEIEFGPHVTSIVGSSDKGKSSIIRALKWVNDNRPRGDSFIRHGKKQATVIITTDSGAVKRKKSKSKTKNLYQLDDQEFKAFGNDVPEAISTALNLSDINFQGQHDSPFWFNDSAGGVSRQLNKIVDLTVIDSTLSNLAGELRKARSEESVIQDRLNKTSEQRKVLKYIRTKDKELKKVENLEDELTTIMVEIDSLASISEEVSIHRDILTRASLMTSDSETVLAEGQRWREAEKKVRDLADIVIRLRQLKKVSDQKIPNIDPLEKSYEAMMEVRKEITPLEIFIKTIESSILVHDNIVKQTYKLKKDLEKKEGELCPHCKGTGRLIK